MIFIIFYNQWLAVVVSQCETIMLRMKCVLRALQHDVS